MTEHQASHATAADCRVTMTYALLPLFCLSCSQSALLLAYAFGAVGTGVYLLCELGLSAAVGAFGAWWTGVCAHSENLGSRTTFVLQLVIWSALAGPFGTLAATALFVPRAVGRVEIARDWRPKLTNTERLHTALLDGRLRLENAHEVRSLLDVVIDGTRLEKLAALSLISRQYVPALAPALKRALHDHDTSVRVLAATVMAQQNNAYTKRIGQALSIANAEPAVADHWRDLGQAHLNYAESGLLDGSRAADEMRQARELSARVAQFDPRTADAN